MKRKSSRRVPDDGLSPGIKHLTAVDPDLEGIYRRFGRPPLWPREPGFPTLIHIILEQQVSLASARAAFARLRLAIDPLTPEAFLRLTDAELLTIGFSRQKTLYGRHLAQALAAGELDLAVVAQIPNDQAVRSALMKLKGIGQWTADIYLLMALRRMDVWPVGDLALAVALQEIKNLAQRPGPEEMVLLAAPWRPFRAVAARLLWHYYLSTPRTRRR